MEIKEDKYHFINDNPSIYILTTRIEALFKAIDEEKDAIHQIGNLIASIPPRLYTKYKIDELIKKRTEQSEQLSNELTNQINEPQFKGWSETHKDQYLQQKSREFNNETYQSIANKVTAIIDELYIHEEERKEQKLKEEEEAGHVKGLL